MYLEYFSLKKLPFKITPDPDFFYSGDLDGRGEILDALLYAIDAGEGILKVVGEVGSGKTMLCRMLAERLANKAKIIYLANPNICAQAIVYAIAFELMLDVDQKTPRLLVMKMLQDYLLEQHAQGHPVVMFIEEAQAIPLETLEEIRLLSNLETHHHKLMQIIMFGQPELDKNLQQKSIRQLRERITQSFYLQLLSPSQTKKYINFRLRAAGCPLPQVFEHKAEMLIAKSAKGLSRRINILADKSLLAAYIDSPKDKEKASLNESKPVVLYKHVKTALKDSNFDYKPRSWIIYGGTLAASIITFAIALILLSHNTSLVILKEQTNINQVSSNEVQRSTSVPRLSEMPGTAVNTNQLIRHISDEKGITYASLQTTVEQEGMLTIDKVMLNSRSVENLRTDELISSRQAPSRTWLNNAQDKQGFSLQLYSGSYQNDAALEQMLITLQELNLLDQSFLCASNNQETDHTYWVVFYDEFETVAQAVDFSKQLPPAITRNSPFATNIDQISCIDA